MKITVAPFTTLDALVKYRADHNLLHGPMTQEKLRRDIELSLQIVAEQAVAEYVRHTTEMAADLRQAKGVAS